MSSSYSNNVLHPDEEILWTGIPKQGILFCDIDAFAIPMSIMFLGFFCYTTFAIIYFNISCVFILFTIIFLFGFVYIGVIRFIINARRRKSMEYFVTNKRLIVAIKRASKTSYKTLPLQNIVELNLSLEKDGHGFITFGNINPVYPWLFGGYALNGDQLYGFELIPNARFVHNVISTQWKFLLSEG